MSVNPKYLKCLQINLRHSRRASASLAQVILETARAGDVVLCMGAGSIGAVPAKVLELAQTMAPSKQEVRGL